jgi:hypothetical protein
MILAEGYKLWNLKKIQEKEQSVRTIFSSILLYIATCSGFHQKLSSVIQTFCILSASTLYMPDDVMMAFDKSRNTRNTIHHETQL